MSWLIVYIIIMEYDVSELLLSLISRGCLFAFSVLIITYASRRVVKQEMESTPELEESVQILTWCHVIAFPIVGSTMLLIMFYFFEYVQLMLALLTLVLSTVTLSVFINPFLLQLFAMLKCHRQARVGLSIDWTVIFNIIIAVSLSIIWIVTNHWILLDLVGVASATFMILFVRIPSLKVATIFMILLLIYDVFWVFLSPSVFQSNVMVEVAEKKARNPVAVLAEKISMPAMIPSEPLLALPGKLIVPSSFTDDSYSMLGLGDVVLPGLLVCLAMRFDVLHETSSVGHFAGSQLFLRCQNISYFFVSIVGYSIGLLLAGLMVELFQYPQPALLYLVPCVLIPLFSKSYIQGQLSILWKGPVFTNNNNALPVINSKLPV